MNDNEFKNLRIKDKNKYIDKHFIMLKSHLDSNIISLEFTIGIYKAEEVCKILIDQLEKFIHTNISLMRDMEKMRKEQLGDKNG